jgi:hypothetical protein
MSVALQAALVSLGTAVLVVILTYAAQSRYPIVRQAAQLLESIMAASRTQDAMAPAQLVAGGGGGTGATTLAWLTLAALPSWSQQGTALPDGNMDPQQYNDCGEADIAMVVAAATGVSISPGSVRSSIAGIGRSGLTTGDDLVQMFEYYNCAAHLETPDAGGAWLLITAVTAAHRPVIMLGTWPTPGPLHWLLATGVAAGRISYINPWGGVRSWIDQATFTSCYKGSLVVGDTHLLYDMHGHSQAH